MEKRHFLSLKQKAKSIEKSIKYQEKIKKKKK